MPKLELGMELRLVMIMTTNIAHLLLLMLRSVLIRWLMPVPGARLVLKMVVAVAAAVVVGVVGMGMGMVVVVVVVILPVPVLVLEQ